MTPIIPRHLPNYSSPDYYIDIDRLMIHIQFELLLQFLESIDDSEWTLVEFNNRPLLDTLNELRQWYLNDYLPYFEEATQDRWMNSVPEPTIVFTPIENSEYTSLKLEFNSPEHESQWNSMMEEWKEYERRFEDEIQRQLRTLIDVRPYLWI